MHSQRVTKRCGDEILMRASETAVCLVTLVETIARICFLPVLCMWERSHVCNRRVVRRAVECVLLFKFSGIYIELSSRPNKQFSIHSSGVDSARVKWIKEETKSAKHKRITNSNNWQRDSTRKIHKLDYLRVRNKYPKIIAQQRKYSDIFEFIKHHLKSWLLVRFRESIEIRQEQ